MKVSVIIPTYNGCENIARAINSVLNQTVKDLEVLVVDDNGQNTETQIKTQNIIKNFSDSRLKYIVLKNNGGGSAARNQGAKQALGEYLMFLDDDDAIESTKLEKQIAALENSDEFYGMAYSSANIYYKGKLNNTIKAKKSGNILYPYLLGKIIIGTGTVLLKRDVFTTLGGYDESFVRHQDWEFFARVLAKFKALAVKDAYFERYIINRNAPKNIAKAEEYLNHYILFLQNANFPLTKRQLKKVINRNNSKIALQYLKAKNFKKFKSVMRKYDGFFGAYFSFFNFLLICVVNKILGEKS